MPRKKPEPKPEPAPDVERPGPRWLLGAAALLVLAAAVRIYAACDDFWFDEVWSFFKFAQGVTSPLAIFRFNHDNNHHLVSLWMYLCGLQDHWFVYRIPSLVGGIASVALAMQAARRWGTWEALAAGVLFASSFVMITYASEARGYALAGCFALVGYLAVDRYLATRSLSASLAFAVAVVLGCLSHASFLFFYAGACAWSAVALVERRLPPRQLAIELVRLHAAPLVFLAGFYWLHVRGMQVGGGPVYSVLDVVREILVLAVGGSGQASLDNLLALGVVAVGVVGLVLLGKENLPLSTFFAVTIVAAPALVLAAQRPPVLYARYFYIPLVFYLLLAAYVVGRLARLGRAGQVAAAAALVLVVLGNVRPTYEFLRDGRGQYLAALEYMAEHSPGDVVLMQADHEFETRFMLAFYAPRLPGKKLVLDDRKAPGPRAPQWLIVNSQDQPFRAGRVLSDDQGRRYELDRVFPYSGLSGYHWAIYRLAQ